MCWRASGSRAHCSLTEGKRGEFFAGEPPAPDWIESAAGLSD